MQNSLSIKRFIVLVLVFALAISTMGISTAFADIYVDAAVCEYAGLANGPDEGIAECNTPDGDDLLYVDEGEMDAVNDAAVVAATPVTLGQAVGSWVALREAVNAVPADEPTTIEVASSFAAQS